jgi:hypothetical protein
MGWPLIGDIIYDGAAGTISLCWRDHHIYYVNQSNHEILCYVKTAWERVLQAARGVRSSRGFPFQDIVQLDEPLILEID